MALEKKRRICCFCESWESGGIESFLCNVLLNMDMTGLEVDIVAAKLGQSVFTEPLKARGVHFYQLSGRQNETAQNHRAFRKLLHERQYDVLHLNLFQGLSLAYAKIAQEAGVPVRIAHSHNTALRKSPTRWLKLRLHEWGKGRYGAACTDFWACSEMAAKFLFSGKDLKEKGYRFIPNGVETQRFRFDPVVRTRVREELGLTDEFVIGNVGRLCGQKNQSFLLEVFREVLRQKPNSRLLLVGGGEELSALQEKAGRLEIADKVVFYGLSNCVEQLFWAMDVFVFPSLFEGLPVTAVEAQAAGLPCIFSDAVTRECKITDTAQFVPLTAPAPQWADAVLQTEVAGARMEDASTVCQAGFDISAVAARIKKRWME